MPFSTARKKLTPVEQAALDALLVEWDGSTEVPLQAAENLRRENGMPAASLTKYLTLLAASREALRLSGIGPKAEFERIGKPFLLLGHPATPFKGAVFGRAVRLDVFARFLKEELDKLRCYDTEEDIRATLRALGDKEEIHAPSANRIYFDAMRQSKLGREVLFATFAKSVKPNQRPWTPPVTSVEIRASCALGEVPPGKDFILFAYHLPDGIIPHTPTTASPGWAYQQWFRPNPKAASEFHGWTEPIGTGIAKRPEIVHSEIDGTTLLFPIHIASA